MNGSIIVTHISGAGDERPIRLRITDESSRVEFLEVSMTYEEWGEMLSGPRNVDCQFRLRNVDKVGMIAQNKTEFVPVEYGNLFSAKDQERIASEALKPFEVDGWKARSGE